MSKQKKQTTTNQLDLFDVLEDIQWEDEKKAGEKQSPESLVVGDIVKVKTWNGDILVGRYVTRGFWDGRDLERPTHYYFDVDGKFFEFNPYLNEWIYVGHDDSYQPPRKDDLVEKLIERLRNVPYTERINAFHAFKQEYPYLSYEYHPYVSEAWRKAIVSVTTEQDVLDAKKTYAWTRPAPKFVQEYIAKHIFPLKGEKRLKAIYQMRWCDWKCTPRGYKNEGWFIGYYPDFGGYSHPVLQKFIAETTSLGNLKTFVRYMQYQTNRFEENPPGLFWLEEDGEVLEVMIPLDSQPAEPPQEEEDEPEFENHVDDDFEEAS
ncbi:hypothetical protein [Collibacillus ludicampi]|uniref:hypothetical protein n=1 Tax=Collibacillus ludicampi TaxID=2771369 RepID=UPI002493F1ED|nr:hypothetical protein [Collibacillus ludicampi]